MKIFVNKTKTMLAILNDDGSADILTECRPEAPESVQDEPKTKKRTYTRKSKGRSSKLTDEDKEDILRRKDEGEKPKDLAKEYGVSTWTIYQLKAPKKRKEKDAFESIGAFKFKCSRGHTVTKRTDDEEIECPMPDCGATAFRE